MVKLNVTIEQCYNGQRHYLEGAQCAFIKKGKVGIKVYKYLYQKSVEIIRRRQITAYNAGLAPKVRSKTIAIEDKEGKIFYGYITDVAIILPVRFSINYRLKIHEFEYSLNKSLSKLFPHIPQYDVHDENYGIDMKTGRMVYIDFDFAWNA